MDHSLSQQDQEHLQQAEQSLLAGDVGFARDVLAKISTAASRHPEVLQVHYHLSEVEGDWNKCLEVAAQLVQVDPGNLNGWLCRAEAYLQLGKAVSGAKRKCTHNGGLKVWFFFSGDGSSSENPLENLLPSSLLT